LLSCFVVEVWVDRIIETTRLLLRPLTSNDGRAIAEKIDNYAISKNLARVPYPYHLSDAEEFLDWALHLDYRSAFRVISLKAQPDQLIGLISYDWQEKAELGYWLIQEHWGKGLMTEAAGAMVELAFTKSNLESLSSCYFNENPASGKVLTHAGFEIISQSTQFSKARGENVPVTMVELTRENWRNKKTAV
jgi:RimJ/RimL family protein N-acetyltransferase